MEKILFVSPHSDDVEFGCGGVISKSVSEKKEVHVAVFSFCEQSVPKGFPKNVLRKEFSKSMKLLGVKNVHLFDFQVRFFAKFRQKILEELYKLNREISPDAVFVPSFADMHQDHKVCAEESKRAFKNSTILGYELPWNALNFSPNFFIEVSSENIKAKQKACSCYKSQSFRKYSGKKLVEALAVVRGIQSGKDFAEAFEAIKFISK